MGRSASLNDGNGDEDPEIDKHEDVTMQVDDASSQMGESLSILTMVGDISLARTELKKIELLGEQQAG